MKLYIIIPFLLIISFLSCSNNQNIPDTSAINIQYDIVRFEDILMQLDTSNIKEQKIGIEKEHPAFTKIYFNNILPYLRDKTNIENNIYNYVTDSTTISLYKIVKNNYGDFTEFKNDFNYSFKLYKHYFPNIIIPNIYTYISSYGYQRFLFPMDNQKDGVAIGLDMFLESEIPYKAYFPNEPQFSDYLTRSFNKDHIVQKTFELLIEDKLGDIKSKTLLDEMIYQGKIVYIIDHLMPTVSDTIIMNYTKEELEWVDNNEYELWTFFRNNELLYNTKPKKIAQFLHPSPRSPGMDSHAPGRTGVYTGWKIVENYMNRNSQITFDELIHKSSIEILKLSKYKPRRKG